MNFIERLSAPKSNNNFYFSDLNVYYSSGYGMPNCTAYCEGRILEICSYNNINYDLIHHYSGYPNAELWGSKTYIGFDWQKSNTPKLGAVVVWARGQVGVNSDGAGHVAIVEQINEDGTITTSNSGWGSSMFWIEKNVNVNTWNSKKNYHFLFFLYPPYIDDTTPTPTPDPEPDPEPPNPPLPDIIINLEKKNKFKWVLFKK